ncbi:MAG: hypothetical protein AAFQ82_27420, partial [Myxococcota bacterium]
MTDAERYARVKEVLLAALERPATARSAYLSQVCGDDQELLSEVEELLAEEESPAPIVDAGVGAELHAALRTVEQAD